jgi:eukaryotic-like serine/threonine-protein kinase
VEGLDFLVMEYLEGETLASRLAKGALPFGQTIQYGIQIASALDAVHRAGIVHRDLKPSNIVLTKSGAKLLDFGLSKATALVAGGASTLPDSLALTSAGIILGTLQYMAPEQLDRSADSRSDIFAVGAVFYEMITGKKAFNGDSHSSLTTAIREYEPSPMSGVPLRVERVIRACLAKDPDDRWQTARDLVRELAWTSDGEADSRDAASQAIIRKARVMAWGSAAAAIALVSAVAAVAFWYLPRVRPNPTVVRFDVLTPTEVQTGYIGNRTNREHG